MSLLCSEGGRQGPPALRSQSLQRAYQQHQQQQQQQHRTPLFFVDFMKVQ